MTWRRQMWNDAWRVTTKRVEDGNTRNCTCTQRRNFMVGLKVKFRVHVTGPCPTRIRIWKSIHVTRFLYFFVQKGLKSICSFQNGIFNHKKAFDCGTPAQKVAFQCNRKSKNCEMHPCDCKIRTFYHYFMCVRSASNNFLNLLLDCKMKLQHFTAVTSVWQILFVLRVMFRVHVYVYWSGSDTYPVFRTRFSPSMQIMWIVSYSSMTIRLTQRFLWRNVVKFTE